MFVPAVGLDDVLKSAKKRHGFFKGRQTFFLFSSSNDTRWNEVKTPGITSATSQGLMLIQRYIVNDSKEYLTEGQGGQ